MAKATHGRSTPNPQRRRLLEVRALRLAVKAKRVPDPGWRRHYELAALRAWRASRETGGRHT